MTKPKVVISSYDDIGNPFYAGGGARSIREVASRLGKEFDITVLTGNYRGAKNVISGGVRYKHIGPSFLGPWLSQLAFHVLLPFHVKRLPFDIWLESFTPPFSTSCLQLYTKKPVIGLVHMLSAEDMVRKYKLPFFLIENRGLRTYRHFITLTETSRAKVSRLNPNANIALIPNGITVPEPIRSQADPEEDFILYIGRLEFNQKGLDLLVSAYASIQRKTNAKLLIAGSGSARDERMLMKQIRNYGLEKRIVLTGKIEGKQKEKLLRTCRLVVIPSRLETFNVVVLEAMAFGKPVVSFDIPGLRWMPPGCALKAPAFDPLALGRKLHQLLADDGLRAELSANAQKSVQSYTWEHIADRYSQTIRVVLSR